MTKKLETIQSEISSDTEPKVVNKTPKRQHNLKFEVASEKEYEIIQFDDPQIVAQIEKEFPEMTMEFKRILFDSYELFCKKQSNYGSANISLGTDLKREEDIDMALKGLWFRINDKVQRFKTMQFGNQKDNVGESLTDTFQDMAIYGIIAMLVQSGKWGK